MYPAYYLLLEAEVVREVEYQVVKVERDRLNRTEIVELGQVL